MKIKLYKLLTILSLLFLLLTGIMEYKLNKTNEKINNKEKQLQDFNQDISGFIKKD